MAVKRHTPIRVLSGLLDLLILGSVFDLPFTYRGARPLTLYEVARTTVEFWGEITGFAEPVMMLNITFVAVFALLIFAGLTALYPLSSGVISVSAMTLMTSTLFIYGPRITLGVGYYVLWITSLAVIGIGVWRRRRRSASVPMKEDREHPTDLSSTPSDN